MITGTLQNRTQKTEPSRERKKGIDSCWKIGYLDAAFLWNAPVREKLRKGFSWIDMEMPSMGELTEGL